MSLQRIIVLTATILLFIVPTTFAKDATVEGNNLNVRSGPGTEYETIGQVNVDEQYEVLEENEDWVKIKRDDGDGWVSKDFVTIQNNEPESTRIKTNKTITIQKSGTHLRKGPSTDYEIIGFVEKGDKFNVLSETDSWLEVSNEEIIGYIYKEHVEDTIQSSSTLNNKTIVIDPGHGGRDVGAIGANGTLEKDFTYLTAHELEKELLALGAEVILTRQGDEFIPLSSRTTLANSVDTDAFLSIHYNSFPEVPAVSGIETFYYHEQYEILAEYVHDEIIKETGERDRGFSFEDFLVTRQTFKPGLLLELGFISNEESESKLQATGYQKKIVSGVVNGLQKYFSLNP